MPLDCAWAEEKPRTDLRVRQPVTCKLSDLSLLRGQIVARLDSPLTRFLARRQQLFASPLSEPLHPHRGEHVVREAKLGTSVDPTPLSAQPLAIQQMRSSKLRTQSAAPEPGDRVSIQLLRGVPRAEESAATSFDSLRPVCAAGACRLHQ